MLSLVNQPPRQIKSAGVGVGFGAKGQVMNLEKVREAIDPHSGPTVFAMYPEASLRYPILWSDLVGGRVDATSLVFLRAQNRPITTH